MCGERSFNVSAIFFIESTVVLERSAFGARVQDIIASDKLPHSLPVSVEHNAATDSPATCAKI